MKYHLLSFLIVLVYIHASAQIGFDTHEVDTTAMGAFAVVSGDADGDGDIDLFAASWSDGIFSWYKNIDGLGDFSSKNIITQYGNARNIDVADLDGDGDLDVILVNGDNKISWFENTNGLGIYANERIITDQSESPYTAKPFDLDGDGDLDVLTASYSDNIIAWHENLDGLGVFGQRKMISVSAIGASDAIAADLDQDGDLDVLFTSLLNNTTAWYKNLDGKGTFGDELILTRHSINPTSVKAKDLDRDGDLDVYITAQAANNIVWWENMDGAASFSNRNYIDINAHNSNPLIDIDMDQDGDLDFVTSNFATNVIEWHENLDGHLALGTRHVISHSIDRIRALIAVDIDDDGDLDVVSASQNDNKIQWYENLNLLSNALTGKVQVDIWAEECGDSSIILPNIRVDTYSENDTMSTYTIATGYYQLYPGIGDYTTTISSGLPSYYGVMPMELQSSFSNIGNSDYQDFCISPIEDVEDVNITLVPPNFTRPGFQSTFTIVLHNYGTVTLDGQVTIDFDPTKMEFISSDLSIVSEDNDKVILSYENLHALELKNYELLFRVFPPPVANIGDVVSFKASVTPIDEDPTPEDNFFELSHILVGSYDPNDISVLEGSQLLFEDIDDYLHYVIRFQNTGTASAIHVRVENDLDSNLDWSTFQPLSLSHRGQIHILNNNELVFNFEHINLPDSNTNEAESHGKIIYKIKPLPSLAIGDSISNTADIYFDFNPPIVTNTVVTHIGNIVTTAGVYYLQSSLFPNPARDILTISLDEVPKSIEILNQIGQLLFKNQGYHSIDINNLNQGIYFCRITDNKGNFVVRKFIKVE